MWESVVPFTMCVCVCVCVIEVSNVLLQRRLKHYVLKCVLVRSLR